MKIFVFDTETTGLFNRSEKDIDKQPYIVQFAWILVNMKDNWIYEEIDRIDTLIKPPIPIPLQTSQIHYIYDIDVINKKTFEEQVNDIMPFINNPDIIVWHNVQFDENMLITEIQRLKIKWLPIDYCPSKTICTMEESINFCAIPRKSGSWFKRPKLQELARKTLWHYFHWGHNAMVDVEYTLKALSELVKNWTIKLKKSDKLTLF